jgi:hypothetical protein
MNFEFLLPAEAEFEEAFDWYAAPSLRAAEGFRERVRRAIVAATQWPTSAGFLVGKRVRKIMLRPYNYGLRYFVHGDVL